MPTFTDTDNNYTRPIPYATEEELLDFANKVRKAGDVKPLTAFFPSYPNEGESCLIANALNFSSSIQPSNDYDQDHKTGEYHNGWWMQLPDSVPQYRVKAIALAMDADAYDVKAKKIKLPRLIGNTAHAFDFAKRGWVTKYRAKDAEE